MTLCTHCKLTTYLFHCIFRGRTLHIPPFRLNSRHCVSSAHWARHSFLRWRCSPQRICLAKGKHSKRFTIDSFFSIQMQDSFTFKVHIICEGQKIWRDLTYTVPGRSEKEFQIFGVFSEYMNFKSGLISESIIVSI